MYRMTFKNKHGNWSEAIRETLKSAENYAKWLNFELTHDLNRDDTLFRQKWNRSDGAVLFIEKE